MHFGDTAVEDFIRHLCAACGLEISGRFGRSTHQNDSSLGFCHATTASPLQVHGWIAESLDPIGRPIRTGDVGVVGELVSPMQMAA